MAESIQQLSPKLDFSCQCEYCAQCCMCTRCTYHVCSYKGNIIIVQLKVFLASGIYICTASMLVLSLLASVEETKDIHTPYHRTCPANIHYTATKWIAPIVLKLITPSHMQCFEVWVSRTCCLAGPSIKRCNAEGNKQYTAKCHTYTQWSTTAYI